ncbi:DUF115 domain-containing protein, partial [bacterium]|nr:DUF115 domain-containing protein [bacterium]
IKESKRWAQKVSPKSDAFLVVLGFGLGYHLKAFSLQPSAFSLQLLVVEQDLELFALSLKLVDFSDLFSSRIILKVGCPEEEVVSTFKEAFSFLRFGQAQILEHPSSLRLNPAYYRRLRKRLTQSTEQEKTRGLTLSKFGRLWQRNILANLSRIGSSPSVRRLFGQFNLHPAIIVSAGPSLDKNVHDLKEVKDKALIISTDTALRTLAGHRIKPHLVASIDPQEINFNRFAGLDISKSCLVVNELAHPKTLRLETKKFISLSDHPFTIHITNHLKDKGYVSAAGGSVATFAFDLARKLGCDPIILVGQDLAYTDSMSYTRTTHDLEEISKFKTLEMKEWEEIRRRDLLEIESIDGGKVLTDYVLWGYLKWFEEEIAKFRNLSVVDATQGGAKISGTKIMSLKEAVKTYCLKELQIEEILARAYQEGRNQETGDRKLLLELKKLKEEIPNPHILEPLLYQFLFDGLYKREETDREAVLAKATKEASLLMEEMLSGVIEEFSLANQSLTGYNYSGV